jgi:hypothetical protein
MTDFFGLNIMKAILYDTREHDIKYYILIEPHGTGYCFAFGITQGAKVVMRTKWSEKVYVTENHAILAANRLLGQIAERNIHIHIGE